MIVEHRERGLVVPHKLVLIRGGLTPAAAKEPNGTPHIAASRNAFGDVPSREVAPLLDIEKSQAKYAGEALIEKSRSGAIRPGESFINSVAFLYSYIVRRFPLRGRPSNRAERFTNTIEQ